MKNIVVTVLLVVILGLVIFYIIKQKKKGNGCIGCPEAGKCSGKRLDCHNQSNYGRKRI